MLVPRQTQHTDVVPSTNTHSSRGRPCTAKDHDTGATRSDYPTCLLLPRASVPACDAIPARARFASFATSYISTLITLSHFSHP
ncbi:hypothetical protein BDZ89DRAFT_1072534 [Hymenopellis radicata]|nr:hypothetical protein BDZ89DRAFT_1072534 [Hymenopellis radicata]